MIRTNGNISQSKMIETSQFLFKPTNILVCLLKNTIFAVTIRPLLFRNNNWIYQDEQVFSSNDSINSRNKTFVNTRTMAKLFFFLIVCHVQCYLSHFWYSSSCQPSFICPTIPGSTLPLFWYPDRFILLVHHSHCHNDLEIYQDGYVKMNFNIHISAYIV